MFSIKTCYGCLKINTLDKFAFYGGREGYFVILIKRKGDSVGLPTKKAKNIPKLEI